MHKRCIAVLALFGCGGPTASAPTTAATRDTAPKVANASCPAGTTPLTGVVVDEHGAKIHSFGVVTTIDYSFTGVYPKAEQFTSRDGSFRTCAPTRDRVDVIIVGLEFARTTIPGVSTAGPEASLGTIMVKPGTEMTGVVQTSDGSAVANASVRIVQSLWADDLLTNLAIGNFETRTDEHGKFSFENYRKLLLGNPAQIFASTTDNAVSPHYMIHDGGGPMTLTIRPAGGLDVVVAGAQDGDIVMIASRYGGFFHQPLRGGHATFQRLSPGYYAVTLMPLRSSELVAGSGADRDARRPALRNMQVTQLGNVNVAAGTQATASLTYAGPAPATP